MQVVVRVRPLSLSETRQGQHSVVACDETRVTLLDPAFLRPGAEAHGRPTYERIFSFDRCLDETQSQSALFAVAGEPHLQSLFQGISCAVLAFGQTGSGKTHSMFGDLQQETSVSMGVVPRLCRAVIEHAQSQLSMATPTFALDAPTPTLLSYSVHASFYEIYNERVHDLLCVSPHAGCRVREHPHQGAYVEGLSERLLTDGSSAIQLVAQGLGRRAVATTHMNAASSRSHAVFTLSLEQRLCVSSEQGKHEVLRRSKVSLVDLAGSERADASSSSSARLSEARSINKSLSALGEVIRVLSEGRTDAFVPYRNSALTWLLRDCLGCGRTVLLANVSAAETSFGETLCTLRYVERAKLIRSVSVVDEGGTEDVRVTVMRLEARLEAADHVTLEQRVALQVCEEELCVAREALLQAGERERGLLLERAGLHAQVRAMAEEQLSLGAGLLLTSGDSSDVLAGELLLSADEGDEEEQGQREEEEDGQGQRHGEEVAALTLQLSEANRGQREARSELARRVLQFDSDMSVVMSANEAQAKQLQLMGDAALGSRARLSELETTLASETRASADVVLALRALVEGVGLDAAGRPSDLLRLLEGSVLSSREKETAMGMELAVLREDRERLRIECVDLHESLRLLQRAKEGVHAELARCAREVDVEMSVLHARVQEQSSELTRLRVECAEGKASLALLREINGGLSAELEARAQGHSYDSYCPELRRQGVPQGVPDVGEYSLSQVRAI